MCLCYVTCCNVLQLTIVYELLLAHFNFQMQVHYTARFADGIVFDSSYKRARPLTMRIGVGKVLIKCSVQFL